MTNLLSWPDTTPMTTGNVEYYFTTSGALSLSSGSITFASVAALTAQPIDCSVT